MKRKISILVMLLIFSGTLLFQSCEEEPVPYKEYGAFTIPELVAPANGAFLKPAGTTVELKWSSTDAEGDPQKWDVYFGPSEEPAKVKTGHTSQTYTVNVDIGTRYYWKVIGFDANGIPTRGNVWSFEIVDPDAPLNMTMTWTTNVLDAIGLDVAPENAANLRLKIINEDDVVVKIVNTTAFEEFTFESSMPDGKYYIITDLVSTINAGDFNSPLDISINLGFNQRGTLSQTLVYPMVMTNENPCEMYATYLAIVTKSGSTYTIAQDIVNITPPVITWYGEDALYPSEVTSTQTCTDMTMSMLLNGWMVDWWGEIIVKGGSAKYTVDASGNITIPFQYYCTTTWNGAVQPDYYIQGTGTIDNSGTYPVIKLHYDIKQGNIWIGHYCYVNYGWDQDGFEAELTTDPSAAGGKGTKGISTFPPVNLVKPVH
ncbi:MAG TPA: hypothetical protein DDW27_19535 [Bacteroidales bacterium]|nr:hypothetical protein [Bacteroidales bacterium]